MTVPPLSPKARPSRVRARTEKLLVDAAVSMIRGGQLPSVTEVAQAAGVSRATAYRYFPSQSALIGAVASVGLGPALEWQSTSADARQRTRDLFAFTYARLEAHEAEFRAVLHLSLEQWTRARAGGLGDEPPLVRGHRKHLLQKALAPLEGQLDEAQLRRLTQALSVLFGMEIFLVLKDIWGLALPEIEDTALWMCDALITRAQEEASAPPPGAGTDP